jgi:hypothetical protein
VLVRVEAAPINPSDLGLLLAGADLAAAVTSGTAERPVVSVPLADGALRALTGRVGKSLTVGNEGAGTVVATGSNPEAQSLLGLTVAVAGGSMYSQYRAVHSSLCLALPPCQDEGRGCRVPASEKVPGQRVNCAHGGSPDSGGVRCSEHSVPATSRRTGVRGHPSPEDVSP